MSTFDGFVAEFPDLRIDYFRANTHHPPPLAGFLRHIHSDHLQGLESLKSPFVYCSPATREILLRLEKYPHRMNFAKGILESRIQTYKHLKKLLKTIPLDTPTTIELSPGNEIQVTLLNTNHCVGAVMFLIQGQGRAILYTGDVRAETCFASRSQFNRAFPEKAEDLRELLTKVSNYPKDTIFHFEAWTFGYEEVWIALSSHLQSPIHLDRYRWRLYKSLITSPGLPPCHEAPPLVGFQLGNHYRAGCLTYSPEVRLHSCERGTFCPAIDGSSEVVRIIPIVARLSDGTEIAEVGIGGGKGDLDQIHELETHDRIAIEQLMHLCASKLEDPVALSRVLGALTAALDNEQGRFRLCASRDVAQDYQQALDDMPLPEFVDMLARLASDTPASAASAARGGKTRHVSNAQKTFSTPTAAGILDEGPHPYTITFPWSRHASYSELCELVGAFRPRDLHPCTVDEESWTPEDSMKALFGHLFSDDVFAHDRKMMEVWEQRRMNGSNVGKRKRHGTRETQSSDDDNSLDQRFMQGKKRHMPAHQIGSAGLHDAPPAVTADAEIRQPPRSAPSTVLASFEKRLEKGPRGGQTLNSSNDLMEGCAAPDMALPGQLPPKPARNDEEELCKDAQAATLPSIRDWAGRAARSSQGMTWAVFGGLVCTGNGHTEGEVEL